MAYRRRKRRFNGVWYPCISPVNTTSLVIPNGGPGVPSWNMDSVTGDLPIGGAIRLANSDLTDQGFYNQQVVRQGYTIKRLVGKIHVGMQTIADATVVAASIVAGLVIVPVDGDGTPRLEGLTGGPNPYDIGFPQNTQKRWLWRRRWQLQNPAYNADIGSDWPHTNAEYGSVLDGPHIDCKPNAHVGLDERLFFYIQGFGIWFNEGSPDIDGNAEYMLDIRMLAKPTTSWTKGR